MKFYLYILFFITVFVNCIGEPYSESFIKNETDNDVILIIRYDPKITNPSFSIKFWLNSFADNITCIKIKTDTLNYTGEYLLKSKGSVSVGGGMTAVPETSFNYLQIRKKTDTITYNSNEEIAIAFTKDKADFYHELTIK